VIPRNRIIINLYPEVTIGLTFQIYTFQNLYFPEFILSRIYTSCSHCFSGSALASCACLPEGFYFLFLFVSLYLAQPLFHERWRRVLFRHPFLRESSKDGFRQGVAEGVDVLSRQVRHDLRGQICSRLQNLICNPSSSLFFCVWF
jgi:hypothetical protein